MHYNPWCECVTDNPHPKYHAYKKDFINKTGMANQAKLMNANNFYISNFILLFSCRQIFSYRQTPTHIEK